MSELFEYLLRGLILIVLILAAGIIIHLISVRRAKNRGDENNK